MRPSRAAGRWGVAALAVALVTGVAPASADPPPPSPGRDLPSDAPTSAPRALAAATLAAGTTLSYDDATRTARLRVDEGGSLDQYLFGPGPITFDIDLQGMLPDAGGGRPVELSMYVFDVDQAGSEDCGPEVDQVSVNGVPLGVLTGANDVWTLNTFTVPAGALTPDSNTFRVDIDTGGTGCWAVEVDWAEVSLPFSIAHMTTYATDDVDVRRGTSEDVIPNLVFSREFDAAGVPGAPTANDPVADAMDDTHWYGSATAGRFTYRYGLDAWPARPGWEPTVTASWSYSGGGGSGSGPAQGLVGWSGDLQIDVPRRTGRYELTVLLKVHKDGKVLVEQQRTTTVYALLGEPKERWFDGLSTSTPKTQWLDRAFELGAGGHSAPAGVAQALSTGIYANPLTWDYIGLGTLNSAEELVEGTGSSGQCFTFRDAWLLLALSVGVDASTDNSSDWYGFATGTRPALDGNRGANLTPVGGATADRWMFGSHSWGTYGGLRYDPTFGIRGADTKAAFRADTLLCTVSSRNGNVQLCDAVDGSGRVYRISSTGTLNTAGWPTSTYELVPPAPAPRLPFAAPLAAPASATPATDSGEDTDGNGAFDWLRVDVPVTVPANGEHTAMLHLTAGDGTYLGTGTLDPSSPVVLAVTVPLTAGTHTLAVRYPGRPLHAAGADGPYTVTGDVRGPDGSVVATVDHTTQAYDHLAFQGPLASVGAVTDEVDGDALRVHVPVTPTASGEVDVSAQVFAGDTQIGTAARQVVLAAGTPQVVTLDVATGPVWASGLDGPYTVHLTVQDAATTTALTHTTAAYDAHTLAPPRARVGPGVTDAGRDADGDGLFDTLDVTTEASATTAGPVTVHAALQTPDGTPVTTATVSVDAGPTPTTVTLPLDGRDIARVGADGPYDVALAVADASGTVMTRAYRTGAYDADDFDPPVALLTGTYTDEAVDTNGDTVADVLRVVVGVTVPEAADVTLGGTLVDHAGGAVAAAQVTTSRAAGAGTLTLDFDGADLTDTAGPFVLTGVEVGRAGQAPEVTALDVHTTAAYPAGTFRPGGSFHVASVTDRGQDDDGDGLFDALVVDVAVRVQEPGFYAVSGRLTDGSGDEIQWAGDQQHLAPGEHVLALRYDGRLLSGRAVDGPYQVQSLSVYLDPTDPATLRTPYTTAAYRWQEFELGAGVRGHVTTDGEPVAGAAVAVPGVAFAVTDASGAYHLALPGAGTYEVVISADPDLAPWRVLVDGVERATGTSVVTDVTDGQTTTIDFVSGGSATVPSSYRPLTGETVLDTRTRDRLGAAGVDVDVAGRAGVPTEGVAAVVLRLQALDPAQPGELRVHPTGGSGAVDPQVAHGFDDAAGIAVVPLGSDGRVHVADPRGRPHVVVSVAGYFPAATGTPGYTPVDPARLSTPSTCPPFVRLTCAADVLVAGRAGVPDTGAAAVLLSASTVQRLTWGSLHTHGTADPVPHVPTLVHAPLRPAAATFVAPLDDDGELRTTVTGARTHQRLSVLGWFPHGTYTPVRSTVVATVRGSTDLQVRAAGVPATGVAAVALQVVGYGGARGGSLSLHPGDAPAPPTADLLTPRWGTTTGLVLVAPGSDGTVRLTATGTHTRVQVAVVGWLPG